MLGGLNIKKFYGDQALAIFIKAPSMEELRRRLLNRGSETEETLKKRLDKAEYEISFAPQFDVTVLNDDLFTAQQEICQLVKDFLDK